MVIKVEEVLTLSKEDEEILKRAEEIIDAKLRHIFGPDNNTGSLSTIDNPVRVVFGSKGDCRRLDISVRVVKALIARYEAANWNVRVSSISELEGVEFRFHLTV